MNIVKKGNGGSRPADVCTSLQRIADSLEVIADYFETQGKYEEFMDALERVDRKGKEING